MCHEGGSVLYVCVRMTCDKIEVGILLPVIPAKSSFSITGNMERIIGNVFCDGKIAVYTWKNQSIDELKKGHQ